MKGEDVTESSRLRSFLDLICINYRQSKANGVAHAVSLSCKPNARIFYQLPLLLMTIVSFSSLTFGYTQELSMGPPGLSFSSLSLASIDPFKSAGLKGSLSMLFFRIHYSQGIATGAVNASSCFHPRRSESSTGCHPLLTIASLSGLSLFDISPTSMASLTPCTKSSSVNAR